MAESQQVFCPNCAALVVADDINIAALVGKCAGCNHIFRLPLADVPAVGRGGTLALEEGPPSRPSGIVHEPGFDGELNLRMRWFTPGLIFLLFFCIAWDGFLVFWYSMALIGDPPKGGQFWLMVLFPICHVAVGVGLTYFTLAGFLNQTRVRIDRDELDVRHGPVPWWGNRRVAVSEIQGVEIDATSTENGQQQFSLSLHHTDGRQLVLLASIAIRQAEYIGYVLAEHLEVPLHRNDVGSASGVPQFVQRIAGALGRRKNPRS